MPPSFVPPSSARAADNKTSERSAEHTTKAPSFRLGRDLSKLLEVTVTLETRRSAVALAYGMGINTPVKSLRRGITICPMCGIVAITSHVDVFNSAAVIFSFFRMRSWSKVILCLEILVGGKKAEVFHSP